MERKTSSLEKTYHKVDLYYDDLRAIYERLKSKTDDVTFETKHYIFKDFDEFINENKSLTFLEISSSKLRILIKVTKKDCRLEGSSFYNQNFNETAETYHYLNEIIGNCERKLLIFSNNTLLIIFALLSFVIVADFYKKFLPHNNVMDVVYSLISLACIWCFIEGKIPCRVYTTHKESTGFWSRKKDDIYLALISGVIGFVFGIISTHFFDKY